MSTAHRRAGTLLPALRRRSRDGVYRICCVCTGNICRSPMAEIMLADKVSRAGLVGDLSPEPSGDVPDPWGYDDQVFEAVYQQLASRTGRAGPPAR